MMIVMYVLRAMQQDDQGSVETLAIDTGLFAKGEWSAPNLDNLQESHQWVVAVDYEGQVVGAAYFGPEQVSYRLWNTYFLAVSPKLQGKGIGRQIMAAIESWASERDVATLIVETSNQESLAQARSFYVSLGYEFEARIRDYYGPGDDKIVYWKSIAQGN